MSNIGALIGQLAGLGHSGVQLATVVSVDRDKRLCEVELMERELRLIDVYLQANDSLNKGVCLLPKVGSWVVVDMIADSRAIVVATSEIDELLFDGDQITLNGGENGGLVKVGDMVGWMEKVYSDLTKLTSLLSTSAVSGNGAPLAIVFTPETPKPTNEEFENSKITH